MADLERSLPDDMMAFMEHQAARLGFGTAGEYLCSLIAEIQKRKAKQDLEAKLLEGLQGPAVPMTREDWNSIEREAREGSSEEPAHPERGSSHRYFAFPWLATAAAARATSSGSPR